MRAGCPAAALRHSLLSFVTVFLAFTGVWIRSVGFSVQCCDGSLVTVVCVFVFCLCRLRLFVSVSSCRRLSTHYVRSGSCNVVCVSLSLSLFVCVDNLQNLALIYSLSTVCVCVSLSPSLSMCSAMASGCGPPGSVCAWTTTPVTAASTACPVRAVEIAAARETCSRNCLCHCPAPVSTRSSRVRGPAAVRPWPQNRRHPVFCRTGTV